MCLHEQASNVNKRSVNYILAASIVALVSAAYVTSFHGVFLFDDTASIFRNANVVGARPVFWGHRWLPDLTFRINLQLSGPDPFFFHLMNLVIHCANALLVFGIARRSLDMIRLTSVAPEIVAWSAGLLWGVHPLATQAVTYICQRYESMTALCMLGSLYLFILGVNRPARQRFLFNCALAVLVLGMGCKETMAVMPAALIAYDHVFCEKSLHSLTRKRGLFHVASFMTIFILLVYQVQLAAGQISGSHQGSRLGSAGSWPYLYSQAIVIFHYLKLALWPSALCFDYSWQPFQPGIAGALAMLVHAVVFCVSAAAVVLRRKWAFMIFSFYLLLAPTSSVVPVADLAAEHRMYAPLIPVVLGVVIVLAAASGLLLRAKILRTLRPVTGFVLASVSLGVVLGLATSVRNMYYWSEVAMWQDVCTKQPANLRARNDLAAALSAEGAVEEALEEYQEVIRRIPQSVRDSCDRGGCITVGSFIKSSPQYAYFVACANLGTMYCNEKRDYDAALEWYLRALRIAPFNPDVRSSAKNLLRASGHAEDDLDQVLNSEIVESIEKERL